MAGRRSSRAQLHRLERAWARQVVRFLKIELDLEGLDHVDPAGTYLVAALHEGFADALALLRLPLDLAWVARDELFEWPTLGRYLRSSDQILFDEGSGVSGARSLYRQVGEHLAAGESVVLFPQGTILGIETAFLPGVFRLAGAYRTPILPVVLTGSHRVWEHPYRPTLRYGQRISMRVLPPEPADTLVPEDLQRRMKEIALDPGTADPRHFNPDRDGFWDGYVYEIDDTFPEVKSLVNKHRELRQLMPDS